MSFLSKEQILHADDREYEEVDVPEWGGKVMVRSMTGKERDKFEASTVVMKNGQQTPNLENLRARLISMCVVTEDRSALLFDSAADVQVLGNRNTRALQRIFNACQRLNGITDDDIEEMTESFEQDPHESSTSD